VFERHGIRVLIPDQIRAVAGIPALSAYKTMKNNSFPRHPGGIQDVSNRQALIEPELIMD
jgi:hypothetical protein